jgi:hypothetical protein
LQIKRKRLPERHTYRRILAYKVYETEVERLVGEYNQAGERGDYVFPVKENQPQLYKNIQALFAPDPSAKSKPIFSPHKKSTRDMSASNFAPSPPAKC